MAIRPTCDLSSEDATRGGIRFGVWYDFRNPEPWRVPYDRLYAELLDQAAWAETLGFESVWLSEHHVTDDGYLPSMFPMLAALAQRTRSMRLGTAVLLAPLHHPIRFAEDAAVIDQLSSGRLELGVAPGYRVEEFASLGIPKRERGSRTESLVRIARHAWTGQPFSYEDRHFHLRSVVVSPTPYQRPHPPLWIGGASIPAATRAGRLGCHFMPDSFAAPEVYETYWKTLAENGHDPSAFELCTHRVIYVCDDPERGWEEVRDHYLYVFNRYRDWFAAAGDFPEVGERLENADDLPRTLHVVGTPDQVAAEIERMRERVAFGRLIFWAKPPGLPVELASRSLELFARKVMPRFTTQVEVPAGAALPPAEGGT